MRRECCLRKIAGVSVVGARPRRASQEERLLAETGRAKIRRLAASVPVAVVCVLGASGDASATAFFINQQSVTGLARVDAGNTAAADDLSTVFFNPAGLVHLFETDPKTDFADRFAVGAHLVAPRSRLKNRNSSASDLGTAGEFSPLAGKDSTNPTDPTPIVNMYWARRLAGGNAAVGAGFNVPFGLGTELGRDWFGRYDAIEASLRTINLSLVGAYRIDEKLSVGGGIDMQYARATLTSAIPNPLTPGGPTAASDGQVTTKGHAWTPGFNVGLVYSVVPERTRVGIHYRSGMRHEISGKTEIGGLTGPLADFNGTGQVHSQLNLPAIATLGLWQRMTEKLVLLGELEWYDWSTFREIRVRYDDGRADIVRPTRYRDTYALAIGIEYELSSELTARGGLQYDRTPTTDGFRDTTVPDSDRTWLGLGFSYKASKCSHFDFAFNHVFFRDTKVDLTRRFFEGTPLQTEVHIDGAVDTVVNTLSMNYRVAF